ncbi:VOC family protein [Prauserella cavernicola]|uniref:VOC family protein n=1 Tax=Prauserella cavernicola TaxID=2800127 RepID=A0A934QZP2_9PSEU|nr:VOC family protein [Prauserella cavernicola]MBK1788464.1 VOC family protein [Prauserella cavernicola]
MSKISTFLWYDGAAKEAAEFYVSLVPNSTVGEVTTGPDGSVMLVTFELDGQRFAALNGGPANAFTEATSIFVSCDSQAEVDELWDRLTEGGSDGQCGWLKDRYGLSWQIIPKRLPELLADPDPARAKRAMEAMLTMGKIDLAAIEAAAGA